MNEDDVHNGVHTDCLQYSKLPWAEHSKKLRDKLFGLKIVIDGRIVIFVKDELETLIIDEFLNFLHKWLRFRAVEFETNPQVLVVKDVDVSLRII